MYSLTHSRRILKRNVEWYQSKSHGLNAQDHQQLKEHLQALNEASQREEREKADRLAREVELFAKEKHHKKPFLYLKEIVMAIIFALAIASVVRASWFELYQIPTGSMRPNFRELDHLSVTKLPFGINIPLVTGHFLFEPDLVQRTSAVTFSGDKIRTIDETTPFLGIFPYKKRLIKRLVGKPGDNLYFYGGKIYGVDSEGRAIEELLNSPWLEKIDYIPYMKFTGEIVQSGQNEATFMQMDKAIGKVKANPFGDLTGSVWNGEEWIKDDPNAQKAPHDKILTYSDWWGMRNYAMARLLTKEQVKKIADIDLSSIPEGVLYLELRHTPSLTYPKPLIVKNRRGDLLLNSQRTVIPLQKADLEKLMDNMYTARLVFENGHGRRYSTEEEGYDSNGPFFQNVPDGTYEFFFGKGYQVNYIYLPFFGKIVSSTTLLADDHPLNSRSPENIQKLFNLGIEMNMAYEPQGQHQLYYPNRYAYFRNGDLYVMGGPLLEKGNTTLEAFNAREEKKEKQSSSEKPYIAFKDYGPPLKNGKIDADFIKTFGVHVPEKKYFMLGDNHAMSADSRIFGFVPEDNLQGAPSLILWPSDRMGTPFQKPYPFMNTSRAIVWSIIAIATLAWYIWDRRRLKKSYNL